MQSCHNFFEFKYSKRFSFVALNYKDEMNGMYLYVYWVAVYFLNSNYLYKVVLAYFFLSYLYLIFLILFLISQPVVHLILN